MLRKIGLEVLLEWGGITGDFTALEAVPDGDVLLASGGGGGVGVCMGLVRG